jgi:hypothetical protein
MIKINSIDKNNENEKKSIGKKELILVFVMSLLSNFLGSWYGYSVANDKIITQAILGLVIPVANMFYANYFIEAKTLKNRMKLTVVAGMALSCGSTLMLLMQKYINL